MIADEQAIEMGRNVAAWDGFEWVAGMLCVWPNGNEYRVAQVNGIDGVNDLPNYPSNGWGDEYPDRTAGVPDLRDRPTQAAVLELIEKATGGPCYISPTPYFVTDNGRKCWRVHSGGAFPHAPTRAEAIAAAVEELKQ